MGSGFSPRLASLDIVELGGRELWREIEQEAVRVLCLTSASLLLQDGCASVEGPPRRTATGAQLPLHGAMLLCEGQLQPGWESAAAEFASQVSRLLRVQEALAAKRRREDELAALYETASQLTAQLQVEHVLSTIVQKARALLAADLAYITLLDRAAGVVRMRVSTGHRTAAFLDIVLPLGAGVGGQVADSARPAYSADYLNDGRLSHHAGTDEGVRREGIRSILGVPLRGRSGVLGVLYVANRAVHVFASQEVSLLKSLGDHAALALENARLYEEAVTAARASAAAEAIAAARLRELERVEEVHDLLTDVVLAGGGVDGIAPSLAEALDAPVMVTDWRQAVLAEVGCSRHVDSSGLLASAFRRRPAVQRALHECGRNYGAACAGEGWLVAPVVARHEVLGYLWARSEQALASSSGFLGTGLKQAARVVALEMLRERAAAETERRLQRDFVASLLGEPAVHRAVLERQARQVWPRFGTPHRPVLLRLADGGQSGGLERARQLVLEARPDDFASLYGDSLVLMLGETDDAPAVEAVEHLRSLLARHGLRAGAVVGRVCRDLAQDRETLHLAARLQELLGPTALARLEGLEALAVLFDGGARDRLRELVERTLAPLAGRPALLATLRAYYAAGGNRAQAARSLRVHVNTLRHRLERTEALLGGPVEEPARAVLLRLALLGQDSMV